MPREHRPRYPNPPRAKFLNTKGNTTLGIGICDRCRLKFPLGMLKPDPNATGLKVCEADRDVYDPYKLPARAPDKVALPFNRPDTPLETPPQPDWLRDG